MFGTEGDAWRGEERAMGGQKIHPNIRFRSKPKV
jgi:hypothetical protein